jgi:hypothetical protein
MITPIEIAPASGPSLVKTIKLPATARKQIVVKLTDMYGKAINLNSEVSNPPAGVPTYPNSEPNVSNLNVSIRLLGREGELGGPVKFDITGTILDQTVNPGFVEFDITAEYTQTAGIYVCEIGRFADTYLVDTWPVHIYIEPSVFQSFTANGPITLPEVRLALLDIDNSTGNSSFSNLLDDVEFTDMEIVYAIRRVVELWNETPPDVIKYTPQNFPYRYNWLVGTCGELLGMAASRYRRNRLAYSAGGVSIDDQSKAQEYEEMSRAKKDEFRQWMTREKYQINARMCWGISI